MTCAQLTPTSAGMGHGAIDGQSGTRASLEVVSPPRVAVKMPSQDISAARGFQRRHLGFQLVDAGPELQGGAGHFLGVEVTVV